VRRMVGIVAIAVVVGAATGCEGLELPAGGATPAGPSKTGSAPAATVSAKSVALAKSQLAHLQVTTPREDGYERTKDFGPAWSVDVNRNGCGTRDDILRRDLKQVQMRDRCTVVGGVLADPYTGQTVRFTKAKATAVQIDHIVPLGAAWARGARDWPQAEREKFANDPANLLATSGSANESKSDRGPAEWLPRSAYRCTYAVLWVRVSTSYKLGVTRPDKASLTTLLGRC
jgi:Protein of unknown function (DUF1524)